MAPILHVNGDDPEAVTFACKLAIDFRQQFKRDIVIDMWCYRRFGHNEGDEPSFTQPLAAAIIRKHPPVSDPMPRGWRQRASFRLAMPKRTAPSSSRGSKTNSKRRRPTSRTRPTGSPVAGRGLHAPADPENARRNISTGVGKGSTPSAAR